MEQAIPANANSVQRDPDGNSARHCRPGGHLPMPGETPANVQNGVFIGNR